MSGKRLEQKLEEARCGFICAGCWTLDRIKVIDIWPGEEELAYILETDRQGGGSAHNLAMDIRKLDAGLPVAAIGLLGQDTDGDFLFEQASAQGLDTRQLHRTEQGDTSYTEVMSASGTGKRTFFHHPGTNDLITPDHFDFSHSNARILHLGLLGVHRQLDSPWQNEANGWVAVLKKARQAGLETNIEMVSIAPERNRQIGLPCLAYLDTLIVNDHEIGSLAEVQTIVNGKTDAAQCLKAAELVMQKGSMHLIVVHFPAGAVCLTRDGQSQQCAAVSVDPASVGSSVGAGDAFAAGMLYALHESWPLLNALQLAHATAAASLRSTTTVGSVEDVDTCLQMAGFSRP